VDGCGVAFPRGFSAPRGEWTLILDSLNKALIRSIGHSYKDILQSDNFFSLISCEVIARGEEALLSKTDEQGYIQLIKDFISDKENLKAKYKNIVGNVLTPAELEDISRKVDFWFHHINLSVKLKRISRLMNDIFYSALQEDFKEYNDFQTGDDAQTL